MIAIENIVVKIKAFDIGTFSKDMIALAMQPSLQLSGQTSPKEVRPGAATILAAAGIVLLLALDIGFVFPAVAIRILRFLQLGVAGLCVLASFRLFRDRGLRDILRQGVTRWSVLGGLALMLLAFSEHLFRESMPIFPAAGLLTIGVWCFLAAVVGVELFQILRFLIKQAPTPHVMVALSFLGLIIIGTLTLLLPTASHGTMRPNVSVVDAFFTATSAVCVTGLIVVDTAVDFSLFGQTIILGLIQLGGLGIMAYVGVFVVSLQRGPSLRDTQLMKDVFNAESFARIRHLLKVMLIVAFSAELIGAALLFIGFRDMPASMNERVFHAVFQSVSSFCNAGFSTFSDSLMGFRENAMVILTTGVLIIIGGLGFHVALELAGGLHGWPWFGRKRQTTTRWSVHLRLVIFGTALLLGFGFAVVFMGSNWTGYSASEVVLSSFFQSLTTRTAGFNSMPLTALSTPVIVVFMVLMLIGGAPGGTAGGIKVSTVGLLFYAAINVARGRTSVEIMRRTMPPQVIQTAFVLTGLALAFITAAFILLCAFEPQLAFRDLLFETISAFGTVGLSLGVTTDLSAASKLLICLVMFCGRVGPLTLFLAVVRKRDEALYTYPADTIVIG